MFQGVSRGSLSIAYPLLIPCLSLAARPDFYRVNTERIPRECRVDTRTKKEIYDSSIYIVYDSEP